MKFYPCTDRSGPLVDEDGRDRSEAEETRGINKRNAVDMLVLDLESLPTKLLVSMMIRCNEEIQDGQHNLEPCLMQLVGMLVSVLGSRDVVIEGGEHSTGAEYRHRVSTTAMLPGCVLIYHKS